MMLFRVYPRHGQPQCIHIGPPRAFRLGGSVHAKRVKKKSRSMWGVLAAVGHNVEWAEIHQHIAMQTHSNNLCKPTHTFHAHTGAHNWIKSYDDFFRVASSVCRVSISNGLYRHVNAVASIWDSLSISSPRLWLVLTARNWCLPASLRFSFARSVFSSSSLHMIEMLVFCIASN